MSNTTSPQSVETIELENDDVKVIRIVIPPGVSHTSSTPRNKRVVIWLKSTNNTRQEHTNHTTARLQPEVLVREPGDIGWRNASSQIIHNTGDTEMETLLIELKS